MARGAVALASAVCWRGDVCCEVVLRFRTRMGVQGAVRVSVGVVVDCGRAVVGEMGHMARVEAEGGGRGDDRGPGRKAVKSAEPQGGDGWRAATRAWKKV